MIYELGVSPEGYAYIRCLRCGLVSYHPQDVQELYCAGCHRWHEDHAQEAERDKEGG